MSKTILAHVEGWTPAIDAITEDLGLLASVVFGRIWRYCQMEDRACRATVNRIADGTGLSRKTVERKIKMLCEAGYLEDRSPRLRNKPHIYADTGKAGLEAVIRATRSESPSRKAPAKSESLSRSVRESDEESKEERIEEESNISADADFSSPLIEDELPVSFATYKPGPGKIISCEDPDTGEVIGEPDWKLPQTQVQHQAFEVTGRKRFYSKAEYNRMLLLERRLEAGKLPVEFWNNRLRCAAEHGWSFPNLLKYTLGADYLRKWERRQ